MALSIQPMVKAIAPQAIRALVEHKSPLMAAAVDWANSEAISETLERELDASEDTDAAAEIREVLHHSQALMNEQGRAALRSVIARDPELVEAFDAQSDTGARAITIFLLDENAFEHALAAYDYDRRHDGQSWGSYSIRDLASFPVTSSPKQDNIDALERRVAELLSKRIGSGTVVADVFDRVVRDRADGSERSVRQVVCYVEEAPEARLRIASPRRVRRRIDRRIVETSAIIDYANGCVDVSITGGKPIQLLFAKSVLEEFESIEGDLIRNPRRTHDLSVLKAARHLEVRPDDPIVDARVVFVTLAPPYPEGGLLMLKSANEARGSDVFSVGSDWFPHEDKLRDPSWRIIGCVIRLFYPPTGKKKNGRAISFKLSGDAQNTLGKLHEDDRTLAVQLLERWAVYAPVDAERDDEVLDREDL